MRAIINNFTCAHQIELESVNNDYMSAYGKAGVRITQCGGSMHFQHDMTCEQARQMAAALIACADEAEASVIAEEAAA